MTEVHMEWYGPQARAKITRGVFRGQQLAGEHLLQVSSALVPHEEGDLERSGDVSSDKRSQTVAVSYDRPYAVRQHEDMTLRHDEGRQAKYLEQPAHTEQATMLEIIAEQARREMT